MTYVIAADAIYVVLGLVALALLFGFCVAILVVQQLVTIVGNRVMTLVERHRETRRKSAEDHQGAPGVVSPL